MLPPPKMKAPFKPTAHINVPGKELIVKQFIQFITNGFQYSDFTDELYHHFTEHCGFPTKSNREYFFDTYFISYEALMLFFACFKDRRVVDKYSEVADLNEYLCECVKHYRI